MFRYAIGGRKRDMGLGSIATFTLAEARERARKMRQLVADGIDQRSATRRICLITCSAGSFSGPDFCPIFAPSMATMGPKSSLSQLLRSVS